MEITVLREIADGARIAPTCRIGPFCVVGPDVAIGEGTVLGSRVTVAGHTTIGRDNLIGDGSVLGAVPQDLKFQNKATYLQIGDRNRLGSNVTAHLGTEVAGYLTRIGHDNVLESGAHVAHDCYVDDSTRLGFGVLLAGHIRVHDGAVLEDMIGVTHFTTIGRFSRVGARTPVTRDVPPFTFFSSRGYYTAHPAVLGVNEEGLAGAPLSEDDKRAVRQAVRHMFLDELPISRKLQQILSQDPPACVRELCVFTQQCLDAHFGRSREAIRGQMPAEALKYLPADVLSQIQGGAK